MLNDAIKGFYDTTVYYYRTPSGTFEEDESWKKMFDAQWVVMHNARSFAEGRRIVRHIDYLATRVVWPKFCSIRDLQFNIYLQGKYNMYEL